MSLKVGQLIKYNADKASGRILSISSNGKHTLYRLSNGDEQLDLDKKVGKPGGVRVIAEAPEQSDTPPDLIGGGLQVIDNKAEKVIVDDLNEDVDPEPEETEPVDESWDDIATQPEPEVETITPEEIGRVEDVLPELADAAEEEETDESEK